MRIIWSGESSKKDSTDPSPADAMAFVRDFLRTPTGSYGGTAMTIPDFVREFPKDSTVTTCLAAYVASLDGIIQNKLNPLGDHANVLAAKATLAAYQKRIQGILKAPEAQRMHRLIAMIENLQSALDGVPEPPLADILELTVTQMVSTSAGRILLDLEAMHDWLTLQTLEF